MAKIKMSDDAKAARQYWYDQYRKDKPAGRGHPYNASFQKDGALFNLLTGRFPLLWIKGMIDFFLQWDDPFVMNSGYSVGVFYSKVNQMLEMNIHRSRWTDRHIKSELRPAAEVLRGILGGSVQ